MCWCGCGCGCDSIVYVAIWCFWYQWCVWHVIRARACVCVGPRERPRRVCTCTLEHVCVCVTRRVCGCNAVCVYVCVPDKFVSVWVVVNVVLLSLCAPADFLCAVWHMYVTSATGGMLARVRAHVCFCVSLRVSIAVFVMCGVCKTNSMFCTCAIVSCERYFSVHAFLFVCVVFHASIASQLFAVAVANQVTPHQQRRLTMRRKHRSCYCPFDFQASLVAQECEESGPRRCLSVLQVAVVLLILVEIEAARFC